MEPKSVLNLSTEILENIVSYIDYPKDLLDLALTTKRFHYIIIPYHLELCHIRCDPGRNDLWKILVEKPILAKNVRMLEIVCPHRTYWLRASSRSTDLVPRFFAIGEAPSTDEYNLNFLMKAIELMTCLVRFSWVGRMPQGVDRVFVSVNNYSVSLRELQVGHVHGAYSHSLDIVSPKVSIPIKRLAHLTALSLANPCVCSRCYPKFYNILVTERELALRDVYLYLPKFVGFFNPRQPQELFKLAHWPKLRRFTIEGDFKIPLESVILDDFINRHVNLEALSVNKQVLPVLEAAQLPRLQSLNFSWSCGVHPYNKQRPFNIPEDIAKRLRHFGPRVSDIKGMQVFQHMTSLRTACLDRIPSISKFVRMVPNLERLYYMQPKSFKKEMQNRIKHLSMLQKLTHLSEFLVLRELSILSPKNEELLKTLANSILSLKYVEVMYQQRAWVAIERDKEGQYIGYRDVDSKEERGLDPDAWGTYFTGFH